MNLGHIGGWRVFLPTVLLDVNLTVNINIDLDLRLVKLTTRAVSVLVKQ